MSDVELLEELKQWARDQKIWPESFECPHYDDCNGSLRKNGLHLDGGRSCSMSYLGKEYAEFELSPNKAFRLVIVGIDPGANYEQGGENENKGIEDWYYGTATKFNPQYRGVMRTAAAILGGQGKYCYDHCYQGRKCVGDKRNEERCVLRLFAQPNLVKCANGPDRKTRSTEVMFINCAQHLVSEIKVLRPNLIVFHAKYAQVVFPKALSEKGYRHEAVPNSPKDGYFPVINEVIAPDGEPKFFALYLQHPSYGWLDAQWDSVVEPALELLRGKGVIPPL
jgi:uracil-DNA glycosylase